MHTQCHLVLLMKMNENCLLHVKIVLLRKLDGVESVFVTNLIFTPSLSKIYVHWTTLLFLKEVSSYQ